MKKNKIFYGTWIVVAVFFIMGVSTGIIWNCASLFIKPICEDIGTTRSQIAIMTSMFPMACFAVALLADKIFSKYKLSFVLKVSSVLLPIFYGGLSFCGQLWQLYILQVLVSLCVAFTGTIPSAILIGRWYKKGYGTAMGIAALGCGLFGMIFSSLTGICLDLYGWRIACRILAACVAALGIPFALFVVKDAPEEVGMRAYGQAETESVEEKESGYMLKDIVKTPAFWGMCLALFFSMFTINTQLQTVSPRLTDLGYSVVFAANITAIALGVDAFGKMALGWMYDKMGTRMVTCLAMSLGALALLGEALASYPVMVLLIIAGQSISSALCTVGVAVLVRYTYGTRDYTAIYGKLSAVASLGGTVGPVVLNYMYDQMGSYDVGLWAYILLALITIGIYSVVLNPKRT